MHLIEHAPAPCFVCGRGNAVGSEADAPVGFIDLERDINWNEPSIICELCCLQIGGMVGMLSGDERQTLRADVKAAKKAQHEAEAALARVNRRAQKLGIQFVDKAVA